jgi:hypothetical protein
VPSEQLGLRAWRSSRQDYFAAYGCAICHDIIDGRRPTLIEKDEILKCQMRGLERTWEIMIGEGLIQVA